MSVKRILLVLALLFAGSIVTALVLVAWPVPHFSPNAERVSAGPPSTVPSASTDGRAQSFTMRDGAQLAGVTFGGADAPLTIVFLHGILESSRPYLATCNALHLRTGSRVIALDLRGHGRSDGPRGDLATIDQYEDDVADVLRALRRETPAVRLILAGHSMGGGIALRYAERHDLPSVDGYLFYAPLLGPRAPTMADAPPAKKGTEPVLVALPRVIGLAMLNGLHVRAFNHLPTMFFNTPPDEPLHSYSFTAMMSMAPRDHEAAMGADRQPMLVLVGANDELFVAARFADIVAHHPEGETLVVPGETHTGVVHSPVALDAAVGWLVRRFSLPSVESKAARPLAPSPSPSPALP